VTLGNAECASDGRARMKAGFRKHVRPCLAITLLLLVSSFAIGQNDPNLQKAISLMDTTAAQFRTALENVRKSNTRKLIVDVRGNAGGDVDEAITAADELLTNGLITSLEGRKVEPKKWQADRATDYDGDVEVLTDASTASGAEIFAAAIHGNSRGKTIGVTTYGKSIVQKFITLPSGGGVFMTVGHYTTPDSKPIKEGGIKPDVVVDLSSQALRDPNAKEDQLPPKEDLILQKALSLYGENQTTPAKKAA